MAKGYWIGRVDVKNGEGYKPCRGQCSYLQKIWRTIHRANRQI